MVSCRSELDQGSQMIDKTRTVKATYIDEWPEDGFGEPGACLRKSGNPEYKDHLAFCCPGCGKFGSIRCIHPKDEGGKSWDIVSGTLNLPTQLTLHPSIHHYGEFANINGI